ncbi:hypothetical protein ACFHWW_23180 [Ensifer sp. P24N7]|uniref:hypothetical protein n=1 Tax=Sinorhizobium sp. P24N7 TaxID=3348358 RepID=UPI0035F2C8E3
MKLEHLSNEMARLGWEISFVGELAGYLRRANGLVIQHPDAKKETRREAFLDGVEKLIEEKCPEGLLEIRRSRRQLRFSEDGYRRILGFTTETDWYRLEPNQRVSAALHRAMEDVDDALDLARQQVAANKHMNFGTPVVRDEEGRPVDVESPIDTTMSGLAATLMMTAYQEGWFQGDILVLPNLPAVDVNDTYKAGSALRLAGHWEQWESIEESARFLGPDLELLSKDQLPPEVPEVHDLAYRYSVPHFQWFNHAAQWRTVDQSRQSRNEIDRHPLKPIPRSLEESPALAPLEFVSENEIHGHAGLNNRLGLETGNSKRLYGGLRIVEWLRGYAVLSLLARQRFDENREHLQIWNLKELSAALCKGGLQPNKATVFLENATFGKARNDLFDSPLLRLHDGRIILIAPCAIDSSPAEIVTSVFARLGFQVDGADFEDRVRELFEANGIPVKAFKTKIAGEEYEYDAIVNWGDHVFLFECKNRSLPGARAIPAYYFQMELAENVHQITRQRDGLLASPQMLNDHFGPGTSEKPITMVVLRNLPFSMGRQRDGVHFYDFSALQRFFHSRSLTMTYGPLRALETFEHTALWSGTEPSPEDLLRELQEPSQLRINRFHTRTMPRIIGLDTTTVALDVAFVREEFTVETMKSWRAEQLKAVAALPDP